MTGWTVRVVVLLALAFGAFLASWFARSIVRASIRRAVRLALDRPGTWRVRLGRLADRDGDVDLRKRQRADAVARMLGHFTTAVIFGAAILVALHVMGVDPVYAISSAGFVGLALALSGQDLIRNLMAGTTALLEDRYAVGDDVTLTVSGNDVRGTVDLVGTGSIRLRRQDGSTWHAGHSTIESVTNHSQIPVHAEIEVDTDRWREVEGDAAQRLASASNDPGLTGVVFVPDLAADDSAAGTTKVTVKTNRPLSGHQRELVKDRLTTPPQGHPGTPESWS
jgi:small-conductance mechanosensitive channel